MVIDQNPSTCVVINGRGFVGRPLVSRLLKLGSWIVRIVDPGESLNLTSTERNSVLSEALTARRAAYYRVDVVDKLQVERAIEGSSVVFYAEASSLEMHNIFFCYMNIVQGAKNIIHACQKHKVKRLIYNSSADVVFDGSHDIHNGNELLPYPWKFKDMLSDFKAQAEQLVLCANDIDGLVTCALRPSNVFGPGDDNFVLYILNEARAGCAKFIIGNGENISDFTYIENVAHAHICAEEALCSCMVSVAGKAFFITNLEPMKFGDFVSLVLEGLGYQRPLINIPARMIWYFILFMEWVYRKLGSKRHAAMSAFNIVHLAAHSKTFNCAAAQNHIGYSPIISLEEGVRLTLATHSHLARYASDGQDNDFNAESKVEKLLGSGKVADILLWRDEKESFAYFLALVLLFYWFFLCGRTFISSFSKLLLIAMIMTYGLGMLPSNILGFSIPKISSSRFVISDGNMKEFFMAMAYLWNRGARIIRSLAREKQWNMLLKVVISLYLVKRIFLHSLTLAVGVALVFSFTSFFLYEQFEAEIDGLARTISTTSNNIIKLLRTKLPVPIASFF